ncbi:MAG TPA: mechanosensitive ion channel family protein [Candidatus Sphingobacterium stercoripullorum]|uniref:Mechanosensitive ion channel family protein n=1 Tax=Candidatus Sphingobacterium stercoripullorum TaxID=2838759 RepID=A0A9D1WB17_9SPHI|nr:mechanosensitive ion channel family protein [Candidatus Sphingobacterium stercoripullorum]
MEKLELSNMEAFIEGLITSASTWLPKAISAIVSALIVLLIGLWLIRVVVRTSEKVFQKRDMDISLERFLLSFINWGLKILLFIVVVTQLGIKTSAFVAMIGATGLAIGLALQGSLANFAGGILILLFKPYRVGEYISSDIGVSGTVQQVDVFNTKLVTPQNQLIVIPNGPMSNSSITNYTHLGTRRTWFDVEVSYDTDLEKAKNILLEVAKGHPSAFKDPAPAVVVTEMLESSVNLSVRVTTSNDKFWAMQEDLIIACKTALDKAGIEIPYPKTDVHVRNNNS